MAFGQLIHRERLSDNKRCLRANAGKLYHLGIGDPVAVSTISRANETRSYKIYETWPVSSSLRRRSCMLTIRTMMSGCTEVFCHRCHNDRSESVGFQEGNFQNHKKGNQAPHSTDLSTAIPKFILVTPASVHDMRILDLIRFEANNFYIIDRGYIDYKRPFRIQEQGAYSSPGRRST